METYNTNYDLTGTFEQRTFEVLRYWAHGKLTKVEIGDKFDLSEGWADKEIGIIYKTLNVHSRHGCVMYAWGNKIFTDLNWKLTMPIK